MKLRNLLTAVALLLTCFSFAQIIVDNPITGTDPGLTSPYTSGQFVATNVTASGISRGPGVTGNVGSNRYNAANWTTLTIDSNDYFEFTITPTPGYAINFSNFVYNGQVSTGAPSFAFKSSVDGFTANIGTPATTGATISLAGGAYQNVSSAITFRLYGFGMFAPTTTYSIDNFTFNGTVVSNAFITTQTGDWHAGSTWVGGIVPSPTDNAIVNHDVSTSAPITRNAGTFTTINVGKTLTATTTYSNSGTTTVNGTFVTSGAGVSISSGSTFLINGTGTIATGGFFINGSPIWGASSNLIYNAGGTYGRGLEWSALGVGTIGSTPGYPNNVTLSGATTLNYNNGTPLAKGMNGNLTINTGSSFYMDYGGGTSNGPLTINGNLSNSGNLTLGTASGDDLKIAGNFTQNAGAAFNGNNRAVFFTKNGVQIITSAVPLTIPHLVFQPVSGNTTVQLASDLTVSAPLGNAISFSAGSDVFDLNGRTLTIGTPGVANTIVNLGTGTFKGTTASNLTLLGTGSIGTLAFTTGSQNLGTLTVDRTSGATAFTLGTPVTINTALTLTNGRAHVGNNPMTIGSSAAMTSSSSNYVIADLVSGSSASLRKVFTAAPGLFTFPIGDVAGNYTPVTTNLAGGSYTLTSYVGTAVNDIKHPNFDASANYLTRYWDIATSGITSPTTFTANGNYIDADVTGTEATFSGNKWNGTAWSNPGSAVDQALNLTNPITCVAGATNHITAGQRNSEINVIATATTTDYLTGSTYNFGNVFVGNNLAVGFTIQNIGQASLLVTAATPTGSTMYSETVAYTTGSISGPTGTKVFTITFTPTAAGTFTGSISIPNTDATGGENPYIINFTGVGVTPVPEINILGATNTLTTLNTPQGFTDTLFPAQTIATTSVAKTYTIQNLGSATLTLSGLSPFVTLSGANPGDFAVSVIPSSSIAASGSTTFSITFTPTQIGSRTATVTVFSNDADEASYIFYIAGTGNGAEIDVFGNGVSIPLGSTPASAANDTQFGAVNITSGTASQTFSVVNLGNVNLTVSSVTITGADAADFSISVNPTGTIAGSAAGTLTIIFNPSTIGVKNATVTIANNDSNEGSYTFAIQGTGVDYIPCGLGAVETIAIQDFEPVPATPTMAFSFTQQAGAGVAGVLGGQARGTSRTVDSDKFIGTRSFQMAGHLANSGTELTTTIDFATIDASAYQDVALNFRLGGYSTSNTQGMDTSPEFVAVYVSTNNGSTWSQEMTVLGNNNSIWSINNVVAASSLNFDGNSLPGSFQAGNSSVNTLTSTYIINNLPSAAQLKIRIVLSVDRTDEIWAVDNVKLEGKKPATSTWNGTAWSPSVPTSSTYAIIAGAYNTTSGNVNACGCQINAGMTVTINANQYFDVQSDITNNGTVNIANSGSLIQRNDAAVNAGTAFNITRTTTPYNKFDYTYWSSPVTNAVIAATFPTWRLDYAFQFATANYADVVAPFDGFDDNGNAWLNVSGTMTPGKGYAIMAPTSGSFPATSTVIFNGAVNNGIINMPVALSADAGSNIDDFNLIGNPYPSALYADQFIYLNAIQNSRISGTLYFWTHRTQISGSAPGPNANNFITNDYAMYNLSGAVGTGSGTGSLTGSAAPTGKIASCQGFFVDAQSASNVVFNNAMRDESYLNNNFFRLAEDSTTQKDRVWLNLENGDGLYSQQLVGYFPNATLGVDVAYDGIVSKTSNTVSFYSLVDDANYRIQARPAFNVTDQVPLGYSTGVAGTFTVAIDHSEGVLNDNATNIYLEDKAMNIVHDLKDGAYSFSTEAGTFNDRFLLRYIDGTLGTPAIDLQNDVILASSEGVISVRSGTDKLDEIIIYDIAGRIVFEKGDISANQFEINEVVRNNQALIVKIRLENGATVTKKLLF